MKKILAIILSLCLLFAVVPIGAYANSPVATDIKLSVNGAPETVYPGQTFSVTVDISDNSGIYAWRADLAYDSDIFSVVSCVGSSDFGEENSVARFSYRDANGNIRMLWDAEGIDNFTENGTVATVTFKVNEVAESGNYTFDLSAVDASRVLDQQPYAENIIITAIDDSTAVDQIAVSTVEILEIDAKEDYYIGDTLVINSISLKVTYNNDDVKTVTSGYTTSYDFSAAGTKTVTVNYEGGTATFDVNVTSPYINLSDNAETVIAGEEYTLTADVLPQGVTVNWVSDDNGVATVEDGVVTAVSAGEATITASFVYNSITYSAECVITVIPVAITDIEITAIDAQEEYFIGDTLKINSISIKVTYNNDDEETVTEDYETSYDFSSEGTKTVTVSYEGFTDTFEVLVKTPSLVLSDSEQLVYLDKTYTITATTIPDNVSVTWKSNDNDIATVEDGVVTAKAEGVATITASFVYNGITYSATCEITVKKHLGDINDDGDVDVADLALMKLYLVGSTTLTEKELAVADVNQTGNTDVVDLAHMKLYLAGALTSFEDIY